MKAQAILDHYDGDTIAGVVHVWLSERNLRTLLAKLERPESKKTIFRSLGNGTLLYVTAESDEEHYKDRTPGRVHPLEEERLKQDAA